MDKNFYAKFEELHRGSHDELVGKFSKYDSLISYIAKENPSAKFIDLGCGSGEFLTYLSNFQISAIGVEKDPGMISKIKKGSRKIELCDALTWLKKQRDSSVDFVSAIHVIEHLEFTYFYDLIGEIRRILSEKGVVLLETPNPDNILVATRNFYVDPTHLRPSTRELTEFVLRHHGFDFTCTWGVNESSKRIKSPSLGDVLGGASPDQTIFATMCTNSMGKGLREILQVKKGRTTKDLCDLFEKRYMHDYSKITAAVKKTEAQIWENSIAMERMKNSFERELSAIYNSRSWKITAPLRSLVKYLRIGKRIFLNLIVNFRELPFSEFKENYYSKLKSFVRNTPLDPSKAQGSYNRGKKGVFYQRYKSFLENIKQNKKK